MPENAHNCPISERGMTELAKVKFKLWADWNFQIEGALFSEQNWNKY